jgi:predicted Zn-dependent protease
MKSNIRRLGKRFSFAVFKLTIIPAVLFFSIGCAEVPVTGRKGLHIVPTSELLTLSLKQYDEVLKTSKLSTDQKKVQMVRRVGERIAKSAEAFLKDSGRGNQIANYKWDFNLIEDDKVVNAWCMPGGKVAVYTGILPYTQDETGLAVVMSHEVAHAIADHGNERMSQALLANMGGMALSVALANKPNQTQQLFMAAFGAGATVGFLLPYSRLHESEADRIGLMFMARAGYDPRVAIPFWERMNKKAGPRPPEFLSTHPAPESRIANIKTYIPEALPYYQRSVK